MKKKPDFTILIINKNDRGVAKTLDVIASMKTKYMPETIVVDASGGKLADIYKRFPNVRCINFKPVEDKPITIAEQRNVGVDAAKSKIILFIDANSIPKAGSMDKLVQAITKDHEDIAVGNILSEGTKSIYDQCDTYRQGKKYLKECGALSLTFKKSAYKNIGGFDTSFDYGSDIDFCWSAKKCGYKIRYLPKATFTHDWGDTKENVVRDYRYGIARGRLLNKHPGRFVDIFMQDPASLVYAVYILGLPLTVFFWPYPLIIVLLLIKNIRKNPFSVAKSHLIYSFGMIREMIRI